MRFLLLGLSRIAKRRVLPALNAVQDIAAVDVASRSGGDIIEIPLRLRGEFFANFDDALARSKADVVYISTVNSEHVVWARSVLDSGRHVIIDKPAVSSEQEAEQLVALAAQKRLCIAEATAFSFHPQIELARDLIRNIPRNFIQASAIFSFPSMDSSDFRYSRAGGGGSFSDVGPYAAATARLLFDRPPERVYCEVLARTAEVDTQFSTLMTFPGGGSLIGQYGFNTEYRNRLSILAPGISIDLDRVYSIPGDMQPRVSVHRNNRPEGVATVPFDCFEGFLRTVVEAIKTGRFTVLAEALQADATLVARLRAAAAASENDGGCVALRET